jgi:hypothetical protein
VPDVWSAGTVAEMFPLAENRVINNRGFIQTVQSVIEKPMIE